MRSPQLRAMGCARLETAERAERWRQWDRSGRLPSIAFTPRIGARRIALRSVSGFEWPSGQGQEPIPGPSGRLWGRLTLKICHSCAQGRSGAHFQGFQVLLAMGRAICGAPRAKERESYTVLDSRPMVV